MVPSQIGVQEGAQALLASSFGIPTTIAVAVVLLLRIRSLIGGAFVAFLIATKKSSLRAEAAEASALAPVSVRQRDQPLAQPVTGTRAG